MRDYPLLSTIRQKRFHNGYTGLNFEIKSMIISYVMLIQCYLNFSLNFSK
ncbi:hypothetical protein M2263_003749 [Providencia alcalifaciens]|nr:hypothetical protein [Providencia alcalifaciens]